MFENWESLSPCSNAWAMGSTGSDKRLLPLLPPKLWPPTSTIEVASRQHNHTTHILGCYHFLLGLQVRPFDCFKFYYWTFFIITSLFWKGRGLIREWLKDGPSPYPRKRTCSLVPQQLCSPEQACSSVERPSTNCKASRTRVGNRPTVILKTMTKFFCPSTIRWLVAWSIIIASDTRSRLLFARFPFFADLFITFLFI